MGAGTRPGNAVNIYHRAKRITASSCLRKHLPPCRQPSGFSLLPTADTSRHQAREWGLQVSLGNYIFRRTQTTQKPVRPLQSRTMRLCEMGKAEEEPKPAQEAVPRRSCPSDGRNTIHPGFCPPPQRTSPLPLGQSRGCGRNQSQRNYQTQKGL